MNKIKVVLNEGAYMPHRAHEWDAGYDLKTPVPVIVPKHGSALINTGVHIGIPEGYAGLLVSKSGLNVEKNLTSTGLIDAGYTGSIRVKLYNSGDTDVHLAKGNKVSQIIIIPVNTPELEIANWLPDTERGDNGFGSTGV